MDLLAIRRCMLNCLVEFVTMVLYTAMSAGIFWFAGI
jgi:hypothetical protein